MAKFAAAKITGAAITAMMRSTDRNEAWLAEKMGVKVPYVYAIKAGKKALSMEQAAKVAEIFYCSLSQFLAVGENYLEQNGQDEAKI